MNSYPGEGNGTPLQYSRLENPMDGGAWWAAVHGVTKSRTRLSNFTFTFHFHALEKEMATHSVFLLENPREGGAWWAAIYGVAQSRTRLKRLSSSSSSNLYLLQELSQLLWFPGTLLLVLCFALLAGFPVIFLKGFILRFLLYPVRPVCVSAVKSLDFVHLKSQVTWKRS